MIYTVVGRLTYVSDITPCTGKVSEKITIVLTVDGKDMAMLLFDNKIASTLTGLRLEDIVQATFSIQSREWQENGKWYTTLFCTGITKATQQDMDNQKIKGKSIDTLSQQYRNFQKAGKVKKKYKYK